MKVAVYSSHRFERSFLESANHEHGHELNHLEVSLDPRTAALAAGHRAVAAFAGDSLDARVLEVLRGLGVELAVLRSAGFNHVDILAAERLGITVLRVPAYSPHAIAEHTVALMLMLNRKLHRAFARVREGNFQLEGLLGFDMHGKTVGIVGTGRIGTALARILSGFGCRLLGSDPRPSEECRSLGLSYVPLESLLAEADVVSLNCPLNPSTHHLIDGEAIARMREGAMLINTSRGAVVDTRALIDGLKQRRIGAVGLDVYEEEGDLFFRDLSEQGIQDDVFARLLTFPNVVITGHQAFFTREALEGIARTTIANLTGFARGDVPAENLVDRRLLA